MLIALNGAVSSTEREPKPAVCSEGEGEEDDADADVALLRNALCSPLGRMRTRTVSMMSASPPPPPQLAPPPHHQRIARPSSLLSRNFSTSESSAGSSISPDAQPRSLLRGRMRKTAIPLLGALVRRKEGREALKIL